MQGIGSARAIKNVGAVTAKKLVRMLLAVHPVVTGFAVKLVTTLATSDEIVASASMDHVVAIQPKDAIVAGRAYQRIRAVGSYDDVCACRTVPGAQQGGAVHSDNLAHVTAIARGATQPAEQQAIDQPSPARRPRMHV